MDMETLKSPEKLNDLESPPSRTFVQVGKIPSLVPSLYGNSQDGREPDGGSAVMYGTEKVSGPLHLSSSLSSENDFQSVQSDRMTVTSGMTTVPEDSVDESSDLQQQPQQAPPQRTMYDKKQVASAFSMTAFNEEDTDAPSSGHFGVEGDDKSTASSATENTETTPTETQNRSALLKVSKQPSRRAVAVRQRPSLITPITAIDDSSKADEPDAGTPVVSSAGASSSAGQSALLPQKGRKQRVSRVKRASRAIPAIQHRNGVGPAVPHNTNYAHITVQGWSRIESPTNDIRKDANTNRDSIVSAASVPPVNNLARMLPNRNARTSTAVITRQLSLAKLETSEPDPIDPVLSQMYSSSTTTTIQPTRTSNIARTSALLPQKGRKQRVSRVQRVSKAIPAMQNNTVSFQGWSRNNSPRSSPRSARVDSTEVPSNNSNDHITVQGWSRNVTPKTHNRKSLDTNNSDSNGPSGSSEPRIHSVNMATGEMVDAVEYSTGLYSLAEMPGKGVPGTIMDVSGRSTSSRSISLSSLRDASGRNYRNLGWSSTEATTIESSDRSSSTRGRGRQNYSSAHTRNSHSPSLSPIEDSYSYRIPRHQQDLYLRQQQLRNSTLSSPFASPSKSGSNRSLPLKEVFRNSIGPAIEEEEEKETPLRYRVRPSQIIEVPIVSSDDSIDSLPSPEATARDDDGPEVIEDSPQRNMSPEEIKIQNYSRSNMGRSASARTTSSQPQMLNPGTRSVSASHGIGANTGRYAQSRFVGADSRFRSSTASSGWNTSGWQGLGLVQPAVDEEEESVVSVERPGAVAIARDGNEAIYDMYRAKGNFTTLNSSQAVMSVSSDMDLDRSSRRQLQQDEEQQLQPPTPSIQYQPPIDTNNSVPTAAVSAVPSTHHVHGVATDERLSLATLNSVNMNAGKNTSCYCKLFLLVVLVLVGGAAIAGALLNSDSSDTPLPTPTNAPTNKPSIATTDAPRDLGRLEDVLEALLPLSTREVMADSSSTQHMALEWLALSDPAQLDPEDENLSERYLVALLYFSTKGDNWFTSDNYLSGRSVCDWKGIICTTASPSGTKETVLSIQLERNNLAGTIPNEIASFSSLQRLYLTGNQIKGSLPDTLGNCTNLFELGLAGNGISSTIPSQIGLLTKLVELGMESNQLSGELPAAIGSLASLSFLSLSRNRITGTLPNAIGNLRNLETLLMPSCKVEELPSEMKELSRLKQLDLGDNLLFGPIPSWLLNMSSLTSLTLDFNQLSSTIPSEFGNFLDLERLWLHENSDIVGDVPTELGNLPKLDDLQLHKTLLTGGLEIAFCSRNGTLPTTLTADCRGVVPFIQCSCCSKCY